MVEIATLYNSGNDKAKSTLNGLVEDLDKLSCCFFYFPTIGWREIILYILPTIAAATAILYHVWGLFPESWSAGVNISAYLTLLTALGLTFLVYLCLVSLSFVEKSRFFVFPEYKAVRFFDRLQKRGEAFLEWKTGGTIYEKEDKLFHSLGMRKEPELPIDIFLFLIVTSIGLSLLSGLLIISETKTTYLIWLLVLIVLFFALRRKAR